MMAFPERYHIEIFLEAGFSVAWNQVECMAHVLNLGDQQILKEFKQPIEKETYKAGSDSCDNTITAVYRLSFHCRNIRSSPKLRRVMERIYQGKEEKYVVPNIDVCALWNSTYDRLVRAIQQQDVSCDDIYIGIQTARVKMNHY
jgi:hypothetical protein